jgi:hypothetical protein
MPKQHQRATKQRAIPGKVETGFPSGIATKQRIRGKKPAISAARAGEVPEDAMIDTRLPAIRNLADLAELTLRYAQTLDGAPAHCRFRECRGGRCHLRIEANGQTVCAAGIQSDAWRDVGKLIGYLIEIIDFQRARKPRGLPFQRPSYMSAEP